MFRKYGFIGIILIVLAEINFIFKIEPFASWYYLIIWGGYILLLDAIVYKLRKDSLIMNQKWHFLGLLFLSAIFWWIFEIANLPIQNWSYNGIYGIQLTWFNVIRKTIFFSLVLPAFFETYELVRSFHLFDHAKLKKKHKITKPTLFVLVFLGILCLILPWIFPAYTFPFVWLAFFFLLDPINYLHKQPSVIKHLKDRNLAIPLSLLLAGIIMGFFWEFWNYYAVTKWYYTIPFVGFLKVFEMPLLGYLGYFPFAFELYAMYFFVRSLFAHKEHLLEY